MLSTKQVKNLKAQAAEDEHKLDDHLLRVTIAKVEQLSSAFPVSHLDCLVSLNGQEYNAGTWAVCVCVLSGAILSLVASSYTEITD